MAEGEATNRDIRNCPQCSRPLQRGRAGCVYCGFELSAEQQQALAEAFGEEDVQKQIAGAEAALKLQTAATFGSLGKLVGKIIIVALAALAALLISWTSTWNPLVITLSVAFFSWPIWIALRKL